jgi:hypothetical protein
VVAGAFTVRALPNSCYVKQMVHLMHSSLHWRLRCIQDSSEDENSPPNTQTAEQPGKQSKKAVETEDSSSDYDYASCGTATPPWLSPGHTQRYTRTGQLRAAPAPAQWIPSTAPATPPASARHAPSPTTSSPILLDTPPRVPLRHTSRQATTASVRQVGRQARRHAADPYARSRPVIREASRPVDADRSVRTPAEFPQRAHSRGRRLHAGFLAVQCSPPPGAVQPAGDRLPIGAPLRVV